MKQPTAILALAFIAAQPSSAHEHEPEKNTGAAIDKERRWRLPSVTFFVCDAEPYVATDELLLATAHAAEAWNAVGAGPRLDVAGAGDCGGSIVDADNASRIGFFQNAWRWPASAAAATTVFRRSESSIIESDIALNPSIEWTFDAVEDRGAFDLWNILTHEIGHALGLPDVQDPRAASMFYVTARGETSKRDLAPEDIGMLLKLYEDIDDPTPGCAAVRGQAPCFALCTVAAALLCRRRR